MGLTDLEVKVMEDKDRQIADLQKKLAKKTFQVAADDDDDEVTVNAVSVKLPPFTESNPELWFGKAEAQFVLI